MKAKIIVTLYIKNVTGALYTVVAYKSKIGHLEYGIELNRS